MYISKGYKGEHCVYLTHPQTGRKTKLSFSTVEKVLTSYLAGKPAEIESSFKLDSFKTEILQYAKMNLSSSSLAIYSRCLNNLIEVFGNLPLKHITNKDIETYKDKRALEVRKTSVNVEIRTLKAIFNIAVKWEYINNNPLKGIKQFSIPEAEPSVFSTSDISLIISLLPNQTLKNIVLFASLTGCRLNEILNVQIKNINLAELHLTIENKADFKTKSRKNRRIPISKKLAELLEGIFKQDGNIFTLFNPDSYLFARDGKRFTIDYISKQFKKALRAGNFPDRFHFHCLRHTFITNLIRSGVNINHVKEIAGHSDIKTTMSYIHLVTEDLREAVNKI